MLTHSTLDVLLTRYEAMAEAARANDWDRLAALELEAAALRDTARVSADATADAAAMAALPPGEAAALRAARITSRARAASGASAAGVPSSG